MHASPLEDLKRLALLEALDLLRPHDDPAFDRVTSIAAVSTSSTSALITFVGAQGQWVASRVGWDRGFHPLLESFCVQALGSIELLEVPDASLDERFANNALVIGPAAVRFYAGHPIVFDGHVLGTVCVLDKRPKRLSTADAIVLADLARLVADLLRVRRERSRGAELSLALERSQETLTQSEDRYRLLWQTTTDAVLIVNVAGTVLFANPAVAASFGHDPHTLVGSPLSRLQPERLRAAHERGFSAYLRSGIRSINWRAVETCGLRADGTEFPIELAFSEMLVGGQRNFAAFIRDITGRKAAEAELAYRVAQFRALTELSTDWYWELDAGLRFRVMSEGAKHSGLPDPQTALGKHPWEARSRDDFEHWREHELRLKRREAFRDVEFTHHSPDGQRYVLQISGEPVYDPDGSFSGYRGVGRDVTERYNADEARRSLEVQLRESQKLEAIGVLAGGIAHDFNNVIAGILGNAQLALGDLDERHPAVPSLQQIRKAGLRAREMVKQILTYARRHPQQLTHFDLRGLLEETLGLIRPTLPHHVALTTQLPTLPVHVHADATQLEQVLINLITNASQAMDATGGCIEVGGGVTTVEQQAPHPSGLAPGHYVHVYVRDDGPGMDSVTAQRVFEPFFTTKPDGEGTGLGLAVVHGIVTGHGGAVRVDTAPRAGSTFHLWLPAGMAVPASGAPPAWPPAPHGRGQRVLYVDDDEVMALMVPRLLEQLGYTVDAFGVAEEGLARFRESPTSYDAVVTDLNMPGLSGLDVAREVTALRPELPVILGSGNLPQELAAHVDFSCVRATFHK